MVSTGLCRHACRCVCVCVCSVRHYLYRVSLQFMDLRTRYTALVTLTTQHVKYISDALRRLEEEEVSSERTGFLIGPQQLGDA